VEGESMTPMLRSGDWVIFCEDGAFTGDGLYVVNFSDQLMVKILHSRHTACLKSFRQSGFSKLRGRSKRNPGAF
ncbi:S24 family peptidase, partial [Campylobacter sp.]|uniref:S24 family peptidase n=1 Tax=Campylobacter sp. TaxID=205 RepID=UPI003FA1390D